MGLALLASTLAACGGGGGGGEAAGGSSPGSGAEPPGGSVPEPLASPTDVVLAAGHGEATVSWSPVPDARGYHIYYAQDAGLTPDDYAARDGVWLQDVSSPHTVTGLAFGETYYFIVTAFAGERESVPSKTAAVTLAGRIANTATRALNDTGADPCADQTDCPEPDVAGQDAESGRDAAARAGTLVKSGGGAVGFDFTKISRAGVPLPADASLGPELSDWACTLDHVTGLLWEVRPDEPAGLRHRGHRYSWFAPDTAANGGNAGTENGGACVGSTCNTHAYAAVVNAETLCGFDDWRLPTAAELTSLVHHGRAAPAIDVDYFPDADVPAGDDALYWTATPSAADSAKAWAVDFATGELVSAHKSYPARVRLVRAGE
ncbi:MAG TPA: DUF1566 domain-containing protein [Gammaproteobacteria bacterium]